MELSILKGIGPKRCEALNKIGIYAVEDIIAYLPVRYRDLIRISTINSAPVDTPLLFKVYCTQAPVTKFPRKNFSITTCEVEDVSGHAQVVWFNQPYFAKNISTEAELYLYGELQIKQGRRRLMNPTLEHEDQLNIRPVYRLPASCGINQKTMCQLVEQAIDVCISNEPEVFSEAFQKKHNLVSHAYAVKNIHFPVSDPALLMARRRLCFEELVKIQLYIKLKKKQNEIKAGSVFKIDPKLNQQFISGLPYSLTEKQSKCVNEIISDLKSGKAMNRLVQGDVGCGKTIVAFIAMYIAVYNGGQAAIMAPTEILARQHYLQLVSFFGEENVSFLSGALSANERKTELERIKNGVAKYIVGTNALIQKNVEYNNLLLIVTDEQHRFGVAQRAKFFSKGNSPHTLVMSATPIPRTLSLILYGDLDISVIDQLPNGRKRISTSIIIKSRENDMLEYIKEQLLSGRQAYFVCPLIEEDDESQSISAEGLFESLSAGALKGINIALLHGKMSAKEKADIMDGFQTGEIKAIISTTVIEVGINVKNATIMVIYGADRFGLAQLHQLRGRVGRGELQSYCFLLNDSTNADSIERLKIMTRTGNGFEIAQYDYDLRGPGDYLGKRQSGISEARFSYALSNTLILKETQSIIENEILPDLSAFDQLIQEIDSKFDRQFDDIAYN